MLIKLEAIAAAAESRGFRVHRGHGSLEIFEPNYTGPDAIHWYGSTYSTHQFSVSDRPALGYGYNDAFNGPYHRGMCQTDDYALKKLLAHPAMSGVELN